MLFRGANLAENIPIEPDMVIHNREVYSYF